MQSFITEAEASKIENELNKMKTDVAELKKLQQHMFSTPFPDKNSVAKYQSLGEQVRFDATKIGGSLKELEKKYEGRDLPEESAFKLLRTQQLNTLIAELNILTNEFFKIQADYMDKMKKRLRTQMKARGDSIDDSKINSLLDQDSYSVFTDNYISDVHDAGQTLRDLDERKKDILALEKSVADVNLLFKDMNLLVSTQGETVDTTESAIDNTAMHVALGKVGGKGCSGCRAHRVHRIKICVTFIGIIVIILAVIITVSVVVSS
ncbi:unnamed protein product [Lymnaea stagnalis]|uniref:t-SNARE coiled-coil homology domain-containing protein n=1 Tax=Lymnaea stagnalis TaxID=6523 RepID=A0AAV2HAP2_LYMST